MTKVKYTLYGEDNLILEERMWHTEDPCALTYQIMRAVQRNPSCERVTYEDGLCDPHGGIAEADVATVREWMDS